MTFSSKTFAYGTLEADTDSWLLAADHVIALDVGLLDSFDGSLAHKTVSVVGTMGIPSTAPGITKLIVEKLASHDAIKRRAYEIYESGQRGSAADHWLCAEREILNMQRIEAKAEFSRRDRGSQTIRAERKPADS